MKFTDKYELLETLTTGGVETFVANDRIRGERVLVHIVECTPQRPDQSTLEWVLESFRGLAPEPVGPVLETGRYSGAGYGYLVTKAADEATEKSWARRYELQTQETRESVAGPAQIEEKIEKKIEKNIEKTAEFSPPLAAKPGRPSADVSQIPKQPAPAPVSVTQLLRNYDSLKPDLLKRDSQIPPAKMKEPAATPPPSINVGQGQSGLHSAPPWEPVHKSAPPRDEPAISRQPDLSGPEHRDRSFQFPAAPSTPKDGPKLGEFTSFFQGPFRGEPSDVPVISAQPIEPPQKKVGDFTAMFGAVGGKSESPGPVDASGVSAQSPGFTGLFNDFKGQDFKGLDAAPQPLSSRPGTTTPAPPAPSALTPRPVEPFPSPIPAKDPFPAPVYVAPLPPMAPPLIPMPPSPMAPSPRVANEKPSAKSSSLPGEGATGAFMNPAANQPASQMPQAPAGPSPYTQIISREKFMAPSTDADGASGGPAAGKFAAPAMPKMPAITPPKMPEAKLPQAPQKPKIAAPKLPKLDAPAPAPPPLSYTPLIITLAVLFVLAAVVVLIFVLKH